MNNYNSPEHINVGSSEEYKISDLAELISEKIGYSGKIIWDTSKPNGTPRRKLDNSKINELGWKSKINLSDGLDATISWYLETGGIKNV